MVIQNPHRQGNAGGAGDEIAHLNLTRAILATMDHNNTYYTLIPGTTFTYESETEDGTKRI